MFPPQGSLGQVYEFVNAMHAIDWDHELSEHDKIGCWAFA
jgi:hypothetical protein